MEPNRENDLDGSNQAIRPEKPRQKKPYSPPKFDILTPGQAKAVLAAKALPGEAATEQLLTSISHLEKSDRTHEERPSLLVEMKLNDSGKRRAVGVRIGVEYLTGGDL